MEGRPEASYVTKKTSLRRIILTGGGIISDAVDRVNRITFHALNLLTYFYLQRLHNHVNFRSHLDIPPPNRALIYLAMRVVSFTDDNRGKLTTNPYHGQLTSFYEQYYAPLLGDDQPTSRSHIGRLLDLKAKELETNVKNNIQFQFLNRLFEVVNTQLGVKEFLSELEDRTDLPEEQRKSFKKDFFSEVKDLKDDLMEGTTTCLEEYRHIVGYDRQTYLPDMKVSVPYDLKADPLSFFAGFMNLHRQLKGKFRFLPLMDSIIPKNIMFDTEALQQLFQIPAITSRDVTWNQIFKVRNHRDFKMKGRTFHYLLHTDGLGASLVFQDLKGRVRKYMPRGRSRKKKKSKKWKDAPISKYMPTIPILPDDLELLETEILPSPIIESILRIAERAKNPPPSPPSEKFEVAAPSIPYHMFFSDVRAVPVNPNRFKLPIPARPSKPTKSSKKQKDPNLYVQPKDIRGKTIVGIDPNKEDLLSMVGKGLTSKPDGRLTTFRYTKCQKNFETRSRKNRKQRDKMARETFITNPVSGVRSSIKQLETTIPTKKTADPDQFRAYLQEKIRVSYLLANYYRQEIFRKMKWHTFINTQRSEAKLINNFASTYGQPGKVIVCFGDYNQANLKHCEPVKGKYYRDLFKRNGYEVFLVDEHRTSITCHECLGELEHCIWRRSSRPWVRERNTRAYPVHGLLRCKTCLQGRRKWNRDVNAARNILGLAICAFHGQDRPKQLQHQKKKSGPAIAGQVQQGLGTASIQGWSMSYANPTLG